jgi:hypothetical protein
MAKLLVSITVRSMKLLPFYDTGKAWGGQGARFFSLTLLISSASIAFRLPLHLLGRTSRSPT